MSSMKRHSLVRSRILTCPTLLILPTESKWKKLCSQKKAMELYQINNQHRSNSQRDPLSTLRESCTLFWTSLSDFQSSSEKKVLKRFQTWMRTRPLSWPTFWVTTLIRLLIIRWARGNYCSISIGVITHGKQTYGHSLTSFWNYRLSTSISLK